MTAPNHIVGGFVITGLLGSFFNLNILASPIYIFSTIIGALIPDIDYTKSTIGKIFRPISKYLNRRFGHRTITHSLLAMFGSFLLSAFIESTFYDQTKISKIYLLGFFSHLVLDMMTVQGVPLFYPFLRNPCVIPGNPNARFKTGNLYSETMIFCFFSICIIFLQPLFENGFWTQYNRYFGTPKHLASEFHKSNYALKVQYKVKRGTEILTGEGICIAAAENEIVLLENNQFHILNKEKYTFLEVTPKQINQALIFKPISFFHIATDSLNKLLNQYPVQHLEVYANLPFQVQHKLIPQITNHFELQYPNDISFSLAPIVPTKARSTPFYPNPRINSLRQQLQQLSLESNAINNRITKNKTYLEQLRSQYQTETNLPNKERLYQEIKTLEKVKLPKDPQPKITELQNKINELIKTDQIKFQSTIKDTLSTPDHSTNNNLSGKITYILFPPKEK